MSLLLFAPWVGVAHAVPTCDTSWANPTSGFWDVAGNWTNGVPGAGSNACITPAGTYTVAVRGGTNAAAGLTLGGASGTQTLEVSGSMGAGNATLTLISQGTASDGVLVNGRIVLTTTDPNAWAKLDVTGGTLTNLGVITVDPGAGNLGGRYWHGAVNNISTGQIAINESLSDSGAGPWTSSGTGAIITVASGKSLKIGAGLGLYRGGLAGYGTVQANVTNGGRVIPGSLGGVGTLTISGYYIQKHAGYGSSTGTLSIEINGTGAGQFDVLDVTGTANLSGNLKLNKPFKATLGQTFPILTAASRAGTFKNVLGAIINSSTGLYYAPVYSITGVTLQVKQATLDISPVSGPPGTPVTVTGGGWIAGEQVLLIFTDSALRKSGPYRVTADGSGNFSTTITIPPGAATGEGSISAKSLVTKKLTPKKTFTVT